jgi:molybdate transport system substrate-binding protein
MWVAWCALVLCTLMATGCDKDRGAPTATSTQPAQQQPAPQELNIAAAADLQFAMVDLANEFRRSHPAIEPKITYGSSGNFYSQISNGAPFDLFFSADSSYPKQLAEHGLTVKDSEFTYGLGRIVLWVPNGSKFDPAKQGIDGLLDPAIHRVAIANPQHAPYGRAAEAALKTHKLWDELQPRLVQGADIAQTAQFVQSGAADAGIIALSLALSPRMKESGSYAVIPASDYPTMNQVGVVLSQAKHPAAADAFRQFVITEKGRSILKQYGFGLPNEAAVK